MVKRENITLFTNVDFHECIPFYSLVGEALDVSGYQFRLKFSDATGVFLSIDGVPDAVDTNKIWFSASQSAVEAAPATGVKWYALFKDPNGVVGCFCYGDVSLTSGGAKWD